jgi:hypothetical protein
MTSTVRRLTLLALYQLSIAFGILMLPVALVARQAGISVPVDEVIDRVGDAYEQTASPSR